MLSLSSRGFWKSIPCPFPCLEQRSWTLVSWGLLLPSLSLPFPRSGIFPSNPQPLCAFLNHQLPQLSPSTLQYPANFKLSWYAPFLLKYFSSKFCTLGYFHPFIFSYRKVIVSIYGAALTHYWEVIWDPSTRRNSINLSNCSYWHYCHLAAFWQQQMCLWKNLVKPAFFMSHIASGLWKNITVNSSDGALGL